MPWKYHEIIGKSLQNHWIIAMMMVINGYYIMVSNGYE
jgi:hypothetical protein